MRCPAIILVMTATVVSASRDATRASEALQAMMSMYDWSTGLWEPGSAPWWQSGNALQALLDYTHKTQSRKYMAQAKNTIKKQRLSLDWWPDGNGEFRADSTDDTGWWALALVRMYDITRDRSYLDIAELDMLYMHQYWDDVCGGGIYWNIPDLYYKNAISVELYIKLAASLYNRSHNDTYLEYALDALDWFQASGMINDDNLVNDGLDEDCINNEETTWTYNQGVILGALVELRRATGNDDLLTLARSIADATLSKLSTGDILVEKCEPYCNADQSSFKGIFARNLAELDTVLENHPYQEFLVAQAESLSENGSNGTFYGLSWSGPFDASTVSISTQSSAVSLLTAIVPSSSWKLNTALWVTLAVALCAAGVALLAVCKRRKQRGEIVQTSIYHDPSEKLHQEMSIT